MVVQGGMVVIGKVAVPPGIVACGYQMGVVVAAGKIQIYRDS